MRVFSVESHGTMHHAEVQLRGITLDLSGL